MKKIYFILTLFFFAAAAQKSSAQCLNGPPADDCANACVYPLSILTGGTYSNSGYLGSSAAGFCGTSENDAWFALVADSDQVTLTLTPSNCEIGNGVQLAIYSDCSANPIACYGGMQGGAIVPATLTFAAVPGEIYLMMVDGYAGDICDYTIEATGITDDLGNYTMIRGKVYFDANNSCVQDTTEDKIAKYGVVLLTNPPQYRFTNSVGQYTFLVPDTGSYTVKVLPPSPDWQVCPDIRVIVVDTATQVFQADFGVYTEVYCTELEVDLSIPMAARCSARSGSLRFGNNGFLAADSVVVGLVLDPTFTFMSCTAPFTQVGDTLLFHIGSLTPGEFQEIYFTFLTSCSTLLGQAVCSNAFIYPHTTCDSLPVSGWSGAHIELSGTCQPDSLVFEVKNSGSGASSILHYKLIKNDYLFGEGNFQLGIGESHLVKAPADGSTWRLEADQEPNHPGHSLPSLSIEGCGGIGNPGFVTQFSQDDADVFVDIECRQVVGSYDPNEKLASPIGYRAEHFIAPGTPLEYTIHFQNTGTDTAHTVVVLDTLSAYLNPATFRPGASSHNYVWEMLPGGVLRFTFPDIMLPDSNVNLLGSEGFVEFRIDQQDSVALGSLLENSAAIYFDFNDPVITNTTFHTIGVDFLVLSLDDVPGAGHMPVRAYPNPFSSQTRIEILRDLPGSKTFFLYDAQGRLLQKIDFAGNVVDVRTPAKSATGQYFFKIVTETAEVASGRLTKAE